jgi:hypothetical protein
VLAAITLALQDAAVERRRNKFSEPKRGSMNARVARSSGSPREFNTS